MINDLCKLQNRRTYDDLWAFHIALSNQFKNIKFPDLPKSSSLPSFKSSKIHDQRIEVFQKLIDQILLNAKQYESLRTKMMSMLYKFAILESEPCEDTRVGRDRVNSDGFSNNSGFFETKEEEFLQTTRVYDDKGKEKLISIDEFQSRTKFK